MNRRQFLVAGGAAAAASGLALPGLAARTNNRPTKLVVIFANGGWDVTMGTAPRLDDPFIQGPRVDERPDIPEDVEELGVYGDLQIALNDCDVQLSETETYVKRPMARQFMDNWSSMVCAVNGIWTGAVGHEPSTIRICTGTQSNINPDLGAIFGHKFGTSTPLGYVAISGIPFVGPYAASSGQFGFNSQLKLLHDKSNPLPAPASSGLNYPIFVQSDADENAVQQFLRERADRWRDLRGENGPNTKKIDDLFESYDRSERFLDLAGDSLDILSVGKSPTLIEQGTLAADLLSKDVCKAILIDSQAAWDSHFGNSEQHANFNHLWSGLDNLMHELQAKQLLDETLVVVMSEMTRTPRINDKDGKDHWPHAAALVMGAGVRGQHTAGGFDDLMESIPMSLQTGEPSANGESLGYAEFIAGLLEHLDIDPAEYLPEATPFRGFKA